jgi:hypothetical protein
MTCEALELKNGKAVLTCNTTDVVFGPFFEDLDAAYSFILFVLRKGSDPRRYDDAKLNEQIRIWREKVEKTNEYAERVSQAWLYPLENDPEPFECENGHEDCSDVENGDCLYNMQREVGMER